VQLSSQKRHALGESVRIRTPPAVCPSRSEAKVGSVAGRSGPDQTWDAVACPGSWSKRHASHTVFQREWKAGRRFGGMQKTGKDRAMEIMGTAGAVKH
jgi:hypothetical protein